MLRTPVARARPAATTAKACRHAGGIADALPPGRADRPSRVRSGDQARAPRRRRRARAGRRNRAMWRRASRRRPAPARSTGFMPTTPQNAAGMRMEPPVSVPNAASTSPCATMAALPLDEPPVHLQRCRRIVDEAVDRAETGGSHREFGHVQGAQIDGAGVGESLQRRCRVRSRAAQRRHRQRNWPRRRRCAKRSLCAIKSEVRDHLRRRTPRLRPATPRDPGA